MFGTEKSSFPNYVDEWDELRNILYAPTLGSKLNLPYF